MSRKNIWTGCDMMLHDLLHDAQPFVNQMVHKLNYHLALFFMLQLEPGYLNSWTLTCVTTIAPDEIAIF